MCIVYIQQHAPKAKPAIQRTIHAVPRTHTQTQCVPERTIRFIQTCPPRCCGRLFVPSNCKQSAYGLLCDYIYYYIYISEMRHRCLAPYSYFLNLVMLLSAFCSCWFPFLLRLLLYNQLPGLPLMLLGCCWMLPTDIQQQQLITQERSYKNYRCHSKR